MIPVARAFAGMQVAVEFEELRDAVRTSEPLRERVADLDDALSRLETDMAAELSRIDGLAADIADLREWQRSLQLVSGGSPRDDAGGPGTEVADAAGDGTEVAEDGGSGVDREPTASDAATAGDARDDPDPEVGTDVGSQTSRGDGSDDAAGSPGHE